MLKKFIKNKKITVVDGDNRLGTTSGELKRKLQDMLSNGMDIKGIQIFHYASIHYKTRWNSYSLRFLNALVNSAASIKYEGDVLSLDDREEPELQRDTSEILAIGLSNMFMCKWYGININKIGKIPGSNKRCDYRFQSNNRLIIYEVKGRKDGIKAALSDCLKKKQGYSADLMYSTICHLPRDGSSVSLHLFDPPVNEHYEYDEYYTMLNHYRNLCEKVGLTILSNQIYKRIKAFEESGDWGGTSLEVGNVIKLGTNITLGNRVFWTRTILNNNEIVPFHIQFGLDKRVIEILEEWNLQKLKEISFIEEVYERDGKLFSVISDGSLFYMGNESLNENP